MCVLTMHTHTRESVVLLSHREFAEEKREGGEQRTWPRARGSVRRRLSPILCPRGADRARARGSAS